MLQQCCSPNPSGRAGRLQCDGLPHSRDTGNGSWIHSLCNSGADPSLNCVVFFLSLSLSSHLSLLLFMLFSFPLAICFFTPLPSRPLCHSLLSPTLSSSFFLSIWPPLLHFIPPSSSSNSCRPSTFPSMLPRGWPWSLTPPACLTQEWLWGVALGCWPFPGPSGPS